MMNVQPTSKPVLEFTHSVFSDYLARGEAQFALEQLLDRIRLEANSPYGFVGEFQTNDRVPQILVQAVQGYSWQARDHSISLAEGTLVTRVASSSSPVRVETHTPLHLTGFPDGHPEISRFFGIQLVHGGHVIGMVGLANSAIGYEQFDFEKIQPLVDAASTIVNSYRSKIHGEILTSERNEQLRQESLTLLAGNLSNDLNNILAAIVGTADLELQRDRSVEPDPKSFEVIRDLAITASELTSHLLTYAGKGFIHRKRVDINEIVSETIRNIRPKVPRVVGLELKLAKPPVLSLGDPSALKKVFSNLLENAVEAISGRPGSIMVETEIRIPKEVSGSSPIADPRPMVVVRIKNDGPSIVHEELHRIFDPYYTTKQPGRGLGLAAVQGIVRAHKGRVSVVSDDRNDTVFEVCLPATTMRNIGSGGVVGTGFTGKCLIVDDEAPVLRVLNGVMTHLGFECVKAINGLEAVNCVRSGEHNFSCAVVDLSMPGMDGRETAVEIRKLNPDLPIVFSTGFATPSISPDLLDLDRTEFVKKPYTIQQMAEGVSRLMTD
jgi:signal transduction histidine kinase/CheY-like chemotaxis protein